MNILVIGSGGREHALSWKLHQSPKCDKLFIAPGNAGTHSFGVNLDVKVTDFDGIKQAIMANEIDMVVVGPEDPLVNGLVDELNNDPQTQKCLTVGPGASGARLEGSKEFSKDFMLRHGIPTAQAQTFDPSSLDAGFQFLETLDAPYVLKADGLAAGKGVIITDNLQEAKQALKEMLVDAKFGKASNKVLVEEFLSGIELSVFVLTDGDSYKILPEAKDYKRIGEGDTGPNTGGMGAISPVPFAQGGFLQSVEEQVVKPTLAGLKKDDIPYKGFIFIGLMNVAGEPYVIEYNVRMGDPETEVVMPRISSDLVDVLEACAVGDLDKVTLEVSQEFATTVMLVSGGYPGSYEKGKEIKGLDRTSNAIIFHAGTKSVGGKTLTNGGRVIACSALGETMQAALDQSYQAAKLINWHEMNYREDIGFDLK